jgi:hypothetical protein
MKFRTVLFPCLVVVLAAAMEFANVAFAQLDDFRNCDRSVPGPQKAAPPEGQEAAATATPGFGCSAKNPGTPTPENLYPLFTFGLFGRDQSGSIANTGTITYSVYIEQGLRFDRVRQDLKPGEVYHFAAFDNEWYSWSVYSLIIWSPYLPRPDPNARAWIQVDQPSPDHRQCGDECTTSFNGCNEGCDFVGAKPICRAACTIQYSICLSNCPP